MPQWRGALPVSDAEVLCSPDTYARGVPYELLDRLRSRTPVVWQAERMADGPGAWAVLGYSDVRRALAHPELFQPEPEGPLHGPTAQEESRDDSADADVEAASVLIDMDPPAETLLDRMARPGAVDFIGQVAEELPETLRNTLAGGLYALLHHPRQYDMLRARRDDDHLLDSTVEEILRWWTPVMQVRRTVRRGTSMGGVPLLAGERLALWLTAANHDEAAFPEPDDFIPDRFLDGAPPHLGFGHGTRACMGGRLARVHLRAFLGAILHRPGRPEFAGEPLPLRSSARHGFERLTIRWAY